MRARLVAAVLLMIGLTSLAVGIHQGQVDATLKLIGEILGASRVGLP